MHPGSPRGTIAYKPFLLTTLRSNRMTNPLRIPTAVLAVIITSLSIFTLPLAAQDARGTVLGRVADASGSVVVGAEVRITNEATGVASSARTNESGNYVLPYLIPGTYTVSSEMSGFKKWSLPGIQVRIQDSVEVNVELTVGSVTETIEVTAATPLLSTAEASL